MQPVNLDDDRADPRTPVGRSLAELDRCDVMVLLLGTSYGETDSHGMSVTHRELRHAAAVGKPIFAYADGTIDPDSPAGRLAAEAIELNTRGGLVDRSELDAQRIINDIKEWQLNVGDDDLPKFEVPGLRAQADDLGFLELYTRDTPPASSSLGHTHSSVLERTWYAFRAAKAGHGPEAVECLKAARKANSLHWISSCVSRGSWYSPSIAHGRTRHCPLLRSR
jgi:hypothetical protein